MKVLSIDFDYFQDVLPDTARTCYPDGLDLPPEISESVWGSRYAQDGDKLNDVGILINELCNIKKIIKNQRKDIPVMIANSHVSIVDFMEDYIKRGDDIDIVNIDMHHDFMNDHNEIVDCGNWLGYMKREYNCNVKWVANPISKEVYGFKEGKYKEVFDKLIEDNLDGHLNDYYDLVFLCKSDNWLVPHLDLYFLELCDTIKHHFDETFIQRGVDTERVNYLKYRDQIKEAIDSMKDALKKDKKKREER